MKLFGGIDCASGKTSYFSLLFKDGWMGWNRQGVYGSVGSGSLQLNFEPVFEWIMTGFLSLKKVRNATDSFPTMPVVEEFFKVRSSPFEFSIQNPARF